MPTTISANEITLRDLTTHFNLRINKDQNFFTEWRDDLPRLTDRDRETLDEIVADYQHLHEFPLLEPAVKMVVISPLLRLAGMYRDPFYFNAEKSVEIVSQDNDVIVRGRLDALVFTPEFWVLAIEAKRTQYSLDVGIPQILAYMLDAPHDDRTRPIFGWVTNGRDFQFLKLQLAQNADETPTYALSDALSLYRGRDLDWVLQILRKIAASFH